MTRPWTLIVGIDFSDSSRRALDLAQTLCPRMKARLELVHVWNARHLAGPGDVVPALESWVHDQRRSLVSELDTWAASARESGIEVSATVVDGVASRVLAERARASDARLLVLGRRGSANLAHVLLGSVSERVVRLAACPVLIVPRVTARLEAPERLMVGVDFSHASSSAYHAALSIARRLGAARGVVLVHTHPRAPDLYLQSWSELAHRDAPPYDQSTLERWAATADRSDVPVALRVLEGPTEQILVDAARDEGCDWLVLGLQGRTALANLLMGSTTDRVLKLSDRPVLVVPVTSPAPEMATG